MHARIFTTDIVGPHAWRQTQTVATIEHFTRESLDITQPHTYHYVNGTTLMRMEFPLLQWSIACVFRLLGEHIWLMRMLLFLAGVVTLAGMGKLAAAIFQHEGAFTLAAWTFCFSPLFYYYCINPLPDLLALCFAVWGLAYFFHWNISRETKALMLCVILLALATLCKLPYVIFYSAFLGYAWNIFRTRPLNIKPIMIPCAAVALSLIAPLTWYAIVMQEWTPNLVTTGILESTLSAKEVFDIITGNLVSTLPELLLNYAAVPLFIAGLWFFFRNKFHSNHRSPLIWIGAAVLLYFVYELNAITLVHDYYLFPFLPLLFLIVTYGALRLSAIGNKMRIAVAVCVLVLPITAFLRADGRWNEHSPGFNPDLITYKEQLQNATPSDAKIIVGNDESAHIGLYYTQHHGWNFHSDKFRVDEIESMISQGATYLYSDSHAIESDSLLQPYFSDTIVTIGSFRIIKLKTPIAVYSDSSRVVPD